jgi:hypothetical protein
MVSNEKESGSFDLLGNGGNDLCCLGPLFPSPLTPRSLSWCPAIRPLLRRNEERP